MPGSFPPARAAFGASVGGRVIAPLAALATTQLSNWVPGATPTNSLATSMVIVVVVFTVIALLCSTRLPEPAPELPED